MPRLTEKSLNEALNTARELLARAVSDARAALRAAGEKNPGPDVYSLIKELDPDADLPPPSDEELEERADDYWATCGLPEDLEIYDTVTCAFKSGFRAARSFK